MNRIVVFVSLIASAATALAQTTAPPASPAPTANDIESLRQQVQALTDTVKNLQQQVKDQQAALEKANIAGGPALPQNPEPSSVGGAVPSVTPPPLIPTE